MDDVAQARKALEGVLTRVDPRSEHGAKAVSRIWSDLGVLKRQSVLASARAGKAGLLERQRFQRVLADFQPGERKTTLGLAAGQLMMSVLQAKLVLAVATVVCEQLAARLPRADGGGDRLRRAGLAGSVQRLAYYSALLCLSAVIPQMGWCARAPLALVVRLCGPRVLASPRRPPPLPRSCHASRLLLGGALLAEPEPLLARVLPEPPVPLAARRRWAHGALGGVRELLRVLRPLAQCAEVALLLLGWYTAFAGGM